MSESNVWDTTVRPNGAIEVLLRPKGSYEVPVIKLYYDSVEEFNRAATKDDGAELMLAMRNASGMAKALDGTYNNREAPPAKTQGKPEGADNPSPQVTIKADPFEKPDDAPPFEAVPDDAPPFYEQDKPEVPQCKHGAREERKHGGKTYWVCGSGLAKDDPDRCAPDIR